MSKERRELEFDTERFMRDVREKTQAQNLRDIADLVGVSAATLSRIDNGVTPDMQTFLTVCGRCVLAPAEYFNYVTWRRVE